MWWVQRVIPNHSRYIYSSYYPVHNVSYPFRQSSAGLIDEMAPLSLGKAGHEDRGDGGRLNKWLDINAPHKYWNENYKDRTGFCKLQSL